MKKIKAILIAAVAVVVVSCTGEAPKEEVKAVDSTAVCVDTTKACCDTAKAVAPVGGPVNEGAVIPTTKVD